MQDYTAAGLGAVAAAAVEQSLQLDLLYFTHQKSFKCDSDDPSYNKSLNGLFAANGHMVQSLPCWRASYALGHPKKKKKKKRKFKFDWKRSLSFGCPSQYATCSPAWRILYHVTVCYKGPIGKQNRRYKERSW